MSVAIKIKNMWLTGNKYHINTIWLLLEQILKIISTGILGILIARSLGVEEYGKYSYVIAIISLLTPVARLGMNGIIQKLIVEEIGNSRKILGTGLLMRLVTGLVLSIPLIFVLNYATNEANKFVLLGLSLIFLFQAFEVIEYYFQSIVNSKLITVAKLWQLLISIVIKLSLIYFEASINYFLIAYLLDYLLIASALLIQYKNHITKENIINYDLKIIPVIFNESWPLLVSSLSIIIHMRLDQVIIKILINEAQLGVYSAAVQLTEVWYIIPTTISTSFFPALVNAYKKDAFIFYKRLQLLFICVLWCAIIISVINTLSSEFLVRNLFGEEYKEATQSFIILIWTSVFVAYGTIWSRWMIIIGQSKVVMLFQINAALCNALLNYILVPKMGITGAAWATLIAASIGHTILPLFIKSQRLPLKMLLRGIFIITN